MGYGMEGPVHLGMDATEATAWTSPPGADQGARYATNRLRRLLTDLCRLLHRHAAVFIDLSLRTVMGGRRTNSPTAISVSRLNAPHPPFVSQEVDFPFRFYSSPWYKLHHIGAEMMPVLCPLFILELNVSTALRGYVDDRASKRACNAKHLICSSGPNPPGPIDRIQMCIEVEAEHRSLEYFYQQQPRDSHVLGPGHVQVVSLSKKRHHP